MMETGIDYRIDYEADNAATFMRNFTDFKAGGVSKIAVVLYWGTYESDSGVYVAAEYTKIKHVLQAASAAGLKTQLDFHTIFPSSGGASPWATPKNLGEDATKILSGAGKTQFLKFITYTLQQVAGLTIDEVAVLNEPSRYTMTATQKANVIQLWKDARAAVKAVRDVPVGVRFELAGTKQFTDADMIDALDVCLVNEYLDSRDATYTIWGAGWSDLQSYIAKAHAKGKRCEVTEWNGYATTPMITQDYMAGHLAKLISLGVDAALFWGWKGTTTWTWDLCNSDNVTPKVPLSVFTPPPPADPCAQYKAVINDLTTRLTQANTDKATLQSTIDALTTKVQNARVYAQNILTDTQ